MLNVQVMNERQVLVVAGDYEVIQQVQRALRGRGFVVHSAYSYRDATYAMRQSKHDVVLVDAAMHDRETGKAVLPILAQQSLHPPLVALAAGEGADSQHFEAEAVVTSLDEQSIQQGVMEALRMPVLQLLELEATPVTSRLNAGEQRLEEIQTLLALGRSLTEVLNQSEVLNRIVEAARRLTNADEGMILLPEAETGELYLRARVGIDVDVARNFRVKTQDTLAGSVFSSGKPLLIAAQGPQKVKTEYFVNSLLYVPILLRGKPIGVLGVNNRHKHDVFEHRHEELLANLASYAAIAIENARIHEESLKQARELKALVDASQVINSSIALERALPNICEQMIRVLNTSRTIILEWDRDAKALRVLAHYDRALWRPGHEPRIELAERPGLKRSLDLNKPFLVTRRSNGRTGELQALERLGLAAMLFLPIQATQSAVAGLFVYYVQKPPQEPAPETFQKAQQLALQAVAYASSPKRQSGANALRLLNELNALLQGDWSELGLMTVDRQALMIRASAGHGLWLDSPYPVIPLDRTPGLSEALENAAPWQHQPGDQGSVDREAGFLGAPGWSTLLGIPLVNRGQVQGLVLFCDSDRTNRYSSHDTDLARAIVGQAATALDNARLFHDLEESLDELRDAQERLIQTARLSAMGELAAAVAHQVNNPLTTIVLDAELMLLNETPGSQRHEVLTAIARAGKRAASVVRRLLTTARPTEEDGKAQPIDVVETVQDVVALVKSHIERDRMTVHVTAPKEPIPAISAIPGQLDDVWLNLLLNAHDALRGRSHAEMGIEVRHLDADEVVEVVVWDNGPGIPEDMMENIFRPFFTTKPVGEGTGLGLHICRQVIERVGGSIIVNSEEGKGTKFFVRLPVKRGE